MEIHEIKAKTVLVKAKRLDSWFLSRYGMNLYRGCVHACAYCDGRAERYRVEGDFGRDVGVKVNALDILRRELDPRRKRKPMRRAYVFLGGGVNDAYQPVEQEYRLARGALKLIERFHHPVHVLTKSVDVEQDLELLLQIHAHGRALVSMSLSCADDDLARVFEPGASPPSARLACLARLKRAGLATGIYLMPVIPFVSDTPGHMERVLEAAREAGVDFVVFSGMTLKGGRQQAHFEKVLGRVAADRLDELNRLYPGDKWGHARPEYYVRITRAFDELAKKHGVPRRMPFALFADLLDENDKLTAVLENLDWLAHSTGGRTPYGRTARRIAALQAPLSSNRCELDQLDTQSKKVVEDILSTGRSPTYEAAILGLD